jgi:beta-glucanase (GH16 family)
MMFKSFKTLALVASITTSVSARPTATAKSPAATHTSAANSYKQIADYTYPNFFDGFTPYTEADPTNGFIDYVDTSVAKQDAMIGWVYREGTNITNAYLAVDSTGNAPGGRQSVRLTSKKTFDYGTLTVIDVLHMPSGAGPGGSGLWPAVWYLGDLSTGGVWPDVGEQDIIEYVNPSVKDNDTSFNAMTLHTAPGCVVEKAPATHLGDLEETDCNSGNGAYGCSTAAPSDYKINGLQRSRRRRLRPRVDCRGHLCLALYA